MRMYQRKTRTITIKSRGAKSNGGKIKVRRKRR